MRERVMGGAEPRERHRVAQVGGQRTVEADVRGVLRPGQSAEALDDLGAPAGGAARQAREHRRRALRPAPGQGVADVLTVALPDRVGQQRRPHERAQVGDHPVLGGLQEEVVPEVVEVLAHRRDLSGDRPQQAAQRRPFDGLPVVEARRPQPGDRQVLLAVEGRHPRVEALQPELAGVAHSAYPRCRAGR
ncbi:hypothetical protein ACFQ0M_10220 [Kitasatospora aburaviensis]